MNNKEDAYVVCPYYKFHGKQMIYCEGVADGTALHLAFATHRQLKDYKEACCRGCWKSCLIAGMLNRKHDYE